MYKYLSLFNELPLSQCIHTGIKWRYNALLKGTIITIVIGTNILNNNCMHKWRQL